MIFLYCSLRVKNAWCWFLAAPRVDTGKESPNILRYSSDQKVEFTMSSSGHAQNLWIALMLSIIQRWSSCCYNWNNFIQTCISFFSGALLIDANPACVRGLGGEGKLLRLAVPLSITAASTNSRRQREQTMWPGGGGKAAARDRPMTSSPESLSDRRARTDSSSCRRAPLRMKNTTRFLATAAC